MKRFLTLLILALGFSAAVTGQNSITLRFTGKNADNAYVRLDSVTVENISRGWTETICYPDTIMELSYNVGIEDVTPATAIFGVTNVRPNPFDGTTQFDLVMPEAGDVHLRITDVNGRLVTASDENLSGGIHTYEVILRRPATYVLHASGRLGTSTAKLVNTGGGSHDGILLTGFAGGVEIRLPLKTIAAHPFQPGDVMRYTGFAGYNGAVYGSQPILQPQNESEDFVLQFDIAFCETVTGEFSATACDFYTWNTETYTTSGDYVQTFTTAAGCDSIVTLHLTVNHSSEPTEFDAVACDSYEWESETYTETMDTTRTLTTAAGCDSTVTLHLIVNHSSTGEFSETACDFYDWNGQQYTASGDYMQILTNAAGCDSTVTLHLTVNHSSMSEFSAAACDNYTWNDSIYTQSGDYVQTFINAAGCDSTVTLHLTINHSSTGEFNATACDYYDWNGQRYTASGDYVQTFTNAAGCDSTVTLHLTINHSSMGEFMETACDFYDWNGQRYTQSGDYVQILANAAGCDSTVTLHLTINHSTTGEFNATACDFYNWNGHRYTTSGDKVQHFTNAAGCDSTVTLHLTINHSSTGEFSATACDFYNWNGHRYTASGDYVQHFTNAAGCDSTVTLHLTIHQSSTNEFNITATVSYTWNGHTYTQSGDYVQTFTNAAGCDSTVTLHLTIKRLPTVTTAQVTDITAITATGGGNVTNAGDGGVTARGVCWSTSQSPTVANSHTTNGSGTGSFTSSITGLQPSTTYYVRAYATNSYGTAYGAQRSFTTRSGLATVTTGTISNITITGATCGGNVTDDGGAPVTARGVCWSTSQNPTVAGSHTTNGSGTGSFTSSITGLQSPTTYYVRAYATNSYGTAYGTQRSFTTRSGLATVTTGQVSDITPTSAVCGGNVTNNGAAPVTARGVCWSTNQNPTVAGNHTTNGSGTGNFRGSLTCLQNSMTYYVRAYATNSYGTAYGAQRSFTTNATDYPIYTNSGFYLTIMGFNNGVQYVWPFQFLNERNISAVQGIYNWIDNMVTGDGTALFYTLDSAMNCLQHVVLPDNLFNVSLISFTDGIDNASVGWNSAYSTRDAYQQAMKSRIRNESFHGFDLDAYGIGVLGNDVGSSVNIFNQTIRDISSDPAHNAHILDDFDEVNIVFSQIASNISIFVTYVDATFEIAYNGIDDICLTFDGRTPANSQRKITAHVSSNRNFTNVTYTGLTAETGPTVHGTQTVGALTSYTFENIKRTDGEDFSTANAMLYRSSLDWGQDSEFDPSTSSTTEEHRKTAAIALVLDMSSSLGNDVVAVKNAAKAFIANLINPTEYTAPAVTTNTVSSITAGSAVCGGKVTGDGNAPVTARGVCWSTDENPTVTGSHTADGSGTGEFTSSITGLQPATTYYVRAYATNATGTSYGTQRSFTTLSSSNDLTFTVGGVIFTMKRVSGGTFYMGAQSTNSGGQNYDADAYDNESPVHQVTLSDYYMGETEVTQALWQAVTGQCPTSGGSQWCSSYGIGDNYPAYGISWNDIQSFLTALNAATASQRGDKTFTMPTEAQWEFAARGGNLSHGYKYAGSNTVGDVAWYCDNAYNVGSSHPDYVTHVVKTKSPNELGLYDMSGNVREWCSDWYNSSYYSSSPSSNPTGPEYGTDRVLRGGSLSSDAKYCRVSYRIGINPGSRYGGDVGHGFRLVLLPCSVATVTTNTVSSITGTTALCGGNVTSDGGALMTTSGVCWSTSPNPTVYNSYVTTDGSGTGSFTSSITGLQPSTTYYVRAYATNAAGTSYGTQRSFTTLSSSNDLTFTVGGVTFRMKPVPGGTFWMGAQSENPDDRNYNPDAIDAWESPVHQVTLSSYYMGETEVTQALWQAVTGQSPTGDDDRQWNGTYGIGNNYPAYYISWNDIQSFLTDLNAATASQRNGRTFAMPTEAQWEFAARGGNSSHGYRNAGSNTVGDVAWHVGNAYNVGSGHPDYGTHVVKTKSPNELGLYDMSGNVFEWCKDWDDIDDEDGSHYYYQECLEQGTVENPTGPSSGSYRVLRGGSWLDDARNCRVSYWNCDYPAYRKYSGGFRLVLLP